MKQDQISHTQLTALVWAGVLAPAAELLPALTLPMAGKGAWLAPAFAIPLVLLSGWLLGRLSEGRGLAGGIQRGLGSVLGVPVLLIYMLWGEMLLALRLRLCAQRLLASGYRDGSLWFFLLGVSALVLWMGAGKLSAFARAGQIFLAVLLTTGGVVLLLSLMQVRVERVLPLGMADALPVLRSSLPAAGVMGWGIYGAFLVGQVEKGKKRKGWHWFFWGAGGCLILTLAQWVVLGNLGPALAGRLDNSYFALAKSVGVEGAFQRVESLIAALWTLADLTMSTLLVFALRKMSVFLFPNVSEQRWAAAWLIPAAAGAMIFLTGARAEEWNKELIPWGNLILGLILPGVILAVGSLFRRKLPSGRYSIMGEGEEEDMGGEEVGEKKLEKNEKKS